MQDQLPITRELLLIGGGHTHALVARMWGMKPLPGVRLTLVNPHPTAPYSGMLPGFVAGHYTRDELDIDLVRLARFANARIVTDMAVAIDTDARVVTTAQGRHLPYHVASVDIGITSAMPDLPGFEEHGVPAKPLDRFSQSWAHFLQQAADSERPARAAILGGGVAGIELAMAMNHALGKQARTPPQIALVEREEILPGMSATRRVFFRNYMTQAGIRLVENDAPVAVTPDKIQLASGAQVEADFVVGAAGARAHGWLTQTGLALHQGYIEVDQQLRSLNTPEVFAVGDCAHLGFDPRPKAGVYAVREAPVLFHNLRAALSGGAAKPFRPQRDYLKLMSLGGKSALADKWGLMRHGPRLWQLKDHIDRKFMNQFNDLAPMAQPPLPRPVADGVAEIVAGAPLCGGCGAKVGSKALARAITPLAQPARDDVLSGPGDDAAILRGSDGSRQVISTDHLRAFSNDPALMARIAAVHALGDVWAMGAQAQAALATVTLPRLSAELQAQWLGEIMAAAAEVFSMAGAPVVGGHSSQGAEFSVGFTVTGLSATAPLTKAGAQDGDWLILTKPIGTGVILAGEMRLAARGKWVMGAYDSMLKPQDGAARILAPVAHAMTDVTGFGLAGHVWEIALASNIGILLDLASVPLLPGAADLAGRGVRSSIWGDNKAMVPELSLPDDRRADLLFDPQTAGGLLAATPPEAAREALDQLGALGFDARVIGICSGDVDGLSVA